jgi:hypothetical protein
MIEAKEHHRTTATLAIQPNLPILNHLSSPSLRPLSREQTVGTTNER